MNRYQGNINAAISNSSAIQFAASYTVYVTPVGGRAASSSSGAVITLDRGHSFRILDRFILNPGTDNTLSAAITAVSDTNNTITTGATTYTIAAGDVLVNIGPDTSSGTTPEYDQIPMAITDQPDGGGIYSAPSVTTDATGNFEFYHRGDGKFWLLVLDSTAAIASVIQGVGGTCRNNICDYGAVMDGSTDDHDRVVGAIEALPDQGGEVYVPAGDVYFDESIVVTRGSFHMNCAHGSRFVVDGNGAVALKVNAAAEVNDVTVTGMWVYDPDPPGHIGTEESHGVWYVNVKRGNIIRCKFDSIGDESIQIGSGCDRVLIDSCEFIDGAHEATDGATVDLKACTNTAIRNSRFYNNQNSSCIVVSEACEHISILDNFFDTTNDTKAVGVDYGNGVAINLGSDTGKYFTVKGNHFKDVIGMAITCNTTGSGGDAQFFTITDNLIEGGGANASSVAFRGAINMAAATKYGVIANNVVDSWGDTAAYHSGIRVNLDGFCVTGNTILGTTNNTYSIYSPGDTGTIGNFIAGNYSDKIVLVGGEDGLGFNKTSTTNVVTFTDTDDTPTVRGNRFFKTNGTTDITDFDNGVVGQVIHILAQSSIKITDNSPITLHGNADFDMVSGDTLTLVMFTDQYWHEVSRTTKVLTVPAVATLADSATPSVADGELFITGGVTTITNFTNGVVGQRITVKLAGAVDFTYGAGTLMLNLGVDWTTGAAGDCIEFVMFTTGVWTEVSRSDNVA